MRRRVLVFARECDDFGESDANINRALEDRKVVGGFFRVRFPSSRFVYRLTDTFAHYAGLLFGIRCGEYAFFCCREIFEQLGGFPEVELMEDVYFSRKLRRFGRIAIVRQPLISNPWRYATRLTIAFSAIWVLYFLRLPRKILHRIIAAFVLDLSEVACSDQRAASYSTQLWAICDWKLIRAYRHVATSDTRCRFEKRRGRPSDGCDTCASAGARAGDFVMIFILSEWVIRVA